MFSIWTAEEDFWCFHSWDSISTTGLWVSLFLLEGAIWGMERLKIAVKRSCKPASSLWHTPWSFFGIFLCGDWAVVLPDSVADLYGKLIPLSFRANVAQIRNIKLSHLKKKFLNSWLSDLPTVINWLWQSLEQSTEIPSPFELLLLLCAFWSTCIISREKALWPTELGMLMDLHVYIPALIILGHGSFVQFFVQFVSLCRQPLFLSYCGCFGIKKKNEWAEWKRM